MKKILSIILALVPVIAYAQEEGNVTRLVADSAAMNRIYTLSDADSAYIQGDYLKAISIYESVIRDQGVNATLYMNLGNC